MILKVPSASSYLPQVREKTKWPTAKRSSRYRRPLPVSLEGRERIVREVVWEVAQFYDPPGTVSLWLSTWSERKRLEVAYCYDTECTICLRLSTLSEKEKPRSSVRSCLLLLYSKYHRPLYVRLEWEKNTRSSMSSLLLKGLQGTIGLLLSALRCIRDRRKKGSREKPKKAVPTPMARTSL